MTTIKGPANFQAAVQENAKRIDGQKITTPSGKTCELKAKVCPDATYQGPFAGPHDSYAMMARAAGMEVEDRQLPWGTNDPAMKDFVTISVEMKRALRRDVFVAEIAFRPPVDGEPGKSAIRVDDYNCYYYTPGLKTDDLFTVIEKAHAGQDVVTPDVKIADPCP